MINTSMLCNISQFVPQLRKEIGDPLLINNGRDWLELPSILPVASGPITVNFTRAATLLRAV